MMPMPPSRANAMAMRPSVTVSMAEEMIGTLSTIPGAIRVLVSTLARHHIRCGRQQQHIVEGQAESGELVGSRMAPPDSSSSNGALWISESPL